MNGPKSKPSMKGKNLVRGGPFAVGSASQLLTCSVTSKRWFHHSTIAQQLHASQPEQLHNLGETGGFPVKPRDFEKPSDKRIDAYAELVNKDLPSNVGLKEILQAVWRNEQITAVCPDLIIRLTSLRGEVRLGISPP